MGIRWCAEFNTAVRLQRGLVASLGCLAALGFFILSGSAAAAQDKCTADDFNDAVDAAGSAMRDFNAEALPKLQGKLKQLKTFKGWTDDDYESKGMDFLLDARIAGFDAKANDLLQRVDDLGRIEEGAQPDCSKLPELRAAGIELLAVMKAKSAYTIGKIDAEISPKSQVTSSRTPGSDGQAGSSAREGPLRGSFPSDVDELIKLNPTGGNAGAGETSNPAATVTSESRTQSAEKAPRAAPPAGNQAGGQAGGQSGKQASGQAATPPGNSAAVRKPQQAPASSPASTPAARSPDAGPAAAPSADTPWRTQTQSEPGADGSRELAMNQNPAFDGNVALGPDGRPIPVLPPDAILEPAEGYTIEEIQLATRGFFGTISTGLASVIEHAFKTWGQPTAYVLGEEGGGAFLAGLRYGKGMLYPRVGGKRQVYWHGPSVGYDFGAAGSRTLILIYQMDRPEDIFRRFTGVDGSAFVVGGVGLTILKGGPVIMAPIRTGLGLRLGANIGYIRFSPEATWNPF